MSAYLCNGDLHGVSLGAAIAGSSPFCPKGNEWIQRVEEIEVNQKIYTIMEKNIVLLDVLHRLVGGATEKHFVQIMVDSFCTDMMRVFESSPFKFVTLPSGSFAAHVAQENSAWWTMVKDRVSLSIQPDMMACVVLKMKRYSDASITFVLFGAEAKGFLSSLAVARGQAFSISSVGVFELLQLGFAREECVVPAVEYNGSEIAFGASYLLGGDPAYVNLTGTIDLRREEGRLLAAKWFTFLSQELIPGLVRRVESLATSDDNHHVVVDPAQEMWYKTPDCQDVMRPFKIAVAVGKTSKKVDVRYTSVGVMLSNVVHIWRNMSEEGRQRVVWPNGLFGWEQRTDKEEYVSRLPIEKIHNAQRELDRIVGVEVDKVLPVLAFPKLSGDFQSLSDNSPSDIPPNILDYLEPAIRAVDVAGGVHFDLYPSNVMVRLDQDGKNVIELKLIDFDFVLIQGREVPVEHKYRLNIHTCAEKRPSVLRDMEFASSAMDWWFYCALEQYMVSGVGKENESFDDFRVRMLRVDREWLVSEALELANKYHS